MDFYEGETNIDNFIDGICVLNKYNMRKVFTNKEKKAAFLRTEKDSLMFFFEDLFRSMYKNWAGFPDLLKYIGPLRYEAF